MSRNALSSCSLVNSGGEPPLVLSCGVLAAAFLGAAMGIPGQRKLSTSLTQFKRARKHRGDAAQVSLCRTATWSKYCTMFGSDRATLAPLAHAEVCGMPQRAHAGVNSTTATRLAHVSVVMDRWNQ